MMKLLTALLLGFATQMEAGRQIEFSHCTVGDTKCLFVTCLDPKTNISKECRTFSLKEYCSNPETLTLEGCKDFPVVERFKDTEAEKLITKGKIISTDTKGRRTILFLKYKSKIYSCTLSTQSNSTTMCERSISR